MENQHFGHKLQSLRGKFRMKQKEVADKVGLNLKTYARLEQKAYKPEELIIKKFEKLYTMSEEELDNYEAEAHTINHFHEPVNQVNNARKIVISTLDEVIQEVLKDKGLLEGKEIKLVVSFKIEQ